jgi:hypothetical protein
MRNEAASRACRERQTQLQHTLPLGSYLLKPVQRILKYHLLLQNIVKHCDRSQTPGYTDIIVALSAMTGIAHHINDMKRKHEHAVRVQEVQSLLDGWPGEDLTTYGELVAEGSFRMYGAKAPRHVFLLDRMLLIVKRKEDGTLGYKVHIMVCTFGCQCPVPASRAAVVPNFLARLDMIIIPVYLLCSVPISC